MKISITQKNVKISEYKAKSLIKSLIGKNSEFGLNILLKSSLKLKNIFFKLLKSGIANAFHNFKIDAKNLIISRIFITRGSIIKRMQPRARGKSYKIEKIYKHITLVLEKL